MKIFVLTIVILALNGYVTRASSLDPAETFEMEEMMNSNNEETRNKRSGAIFSSLMNKKLKLLGSLSGSSSSKSIGHPSGHSGHFEQPPLSYHTKSFDLWGVKKAIFSSVLQAAKAITGGVIALKGQLIKAKGHMVVAKGKMLQNKGQAISNFGQTIATHAFDVHHEQPPPPPPHHVEVHSNLYNHLPATPVHQPTSYGAPSAMGYQEQVYSNNAYQPDTGYHGSQHYPTAPASTGYEGGASDYSGFGGGNGYSGKRAVQNDGHRLTMNQLTSALDKDTVRAGLLLFKPIKLPHGTTGGGSSAFQNSGLEHLFSQQPADMGKIFSLQDYKTASSQETINLPSPFPKFQGTPTQSGGGYSSYQTPTQSGGGYSSYQTPTYVTQQNTGYPSQGADYQQFPPNSAGGTSDSGERVSAIPNHHNGYGFQDYKSQESTISQELGSQAGGGFSGHQLQSYSQERGYDQNESASMSQEHDAQATYTVSRSAENPRKTKPSNTGAAFTRSERIVADFFLQTTPKYNNDRPISSKKRSVAKNDELATLESVEPASIVPLKYDSDSSRAAEEQAKLKQTVQRFFSILQQPHYNATSSPGTFQIRSSQNSVTNSGGNKSKHSFVIQPKTSRRKIDNNIKEKLLQSKLNAYKAKQNELLTNFAELSQIYHKCIQLSKTVYLPKNKYVEDIETVIARIMAEAYRTCTFDPAESDTYTAEFKRQDSNAVGREERTIPFGMGDLRVWNRRSRHDTVLDAIAGKLLDVYTRFWTQAARVAAQNQRPRSSVIKSTGEELADRVPSSRPMAMPGVRDLVEIVVAVRDALSGNHRRRHDDYDPNARQKLAAVASETHARRSGRGPALKVDRIPPQKEDRSSRADGQPPALRRESTRELRKRLVLVTERLKAVDKEKRDLMVAVHRVQLDPSVASLRAALDKEKKKNVNLQSVVDKMFAASGTVRNCPLCDLYTNADIN